MNFNSRLQLPIYFFLLSIALLLTACYDKPIPRTNLNRATFKPVFGIHFTEIRRRLASGRSFDNKGYEVSPEWKMCFLSNDSASIYSPHDKVFLTFPVTLDHDSLFNTARTWMRVKKITKDSLVFQVMEVESTVIYLLRSNLYMTFYSDNYLKNVLKIDPEELKKPDRADTAFVKAKALQSNTYPDSLFAAREPVVLTAKSPLIKIEKEKVVADTTNNFNTAEAYLNPVYNITINKAYQNFSYSFTALVDEKGEMHFVKNLIYSYPEYRESTIKIIKGIIDGYFKLYMNVTPGNTLGFRHASLITLNVYGRK